MNKRLYLFIIIQFSSLFLFGQKYTVSGFVNDYDTGEAIAGAYIQRVQKNIAITNNYGFFSIDLNASDTTGLTADYIGYFPTKKKIGATNDTLISFKLRPSNIIEEIIVQGKKRDINQAGNNKLSIPIQDVLLMPQTAGESDIMKVWQTLPTVGFGDEAKSNLFVRGGSSDQNLILLDDVPLFYVNHLGGFFSIFNTDVLKSADLYTGAFPAKFSGRLSSIADIRMREGNNKKFESTASVGLLASRFSFEGPIIKNKSSFLLSARTSYLPIFTRIFDLDLHYNFYDVNFKANHNFSHRNKLYFSYYKGNDKIKTSMKGSNENNKISNELNWGNQMFALRWNHLFSNRLFANTVAYYSQYRYRSAFAQNRQNSNFSESVNATRSSEIADLGLKSDYEFYISSNSVLTFGLQFVKHHFAPLDYHYIQENSEYPSISYSNSTERFISYKANLYAAHYIQFSEFLKTNYGINLVAYHYEKYTELFPEPRISFKIPFKKIAFNISYARMSQDLHSVKNSSEAIQSDYFIPASKDYPFQYSDIFSVGAKSGINDKINIGISSYYKKFSRLISPTTGTDFFNFKPDSSKLIDPNGKGKAYGIEALSSFKTEKISGQISASVSKSIRKFETYNQGISYLYDYSRLFELNISGTYRPTDKVILSFNWIFATGRPATLPIGKIPAHDNGYILLYENINNSLMENYHRLDVALVYTKKNKLGENTLNVSVTNLYNRKNPYYYFIDYGDEEKGLSLYKQSLFPIMPSISYSLKF